jgi:cytoskeletal protein CcmA (bactofilin family)
MMPNFRRSEHDGASGAQTDGAAGFAPRPLVAVGTRSEARSVSVVGADLVITGNLVSKGEVQVDGRITGDVRGSHVIVGENAVVEGGVYAEEVIVRGHVVGSVRGRRVMLQASSQVDGDIYHQALSIEQGAMFEGKSRRTTEDPRTVAVQQATSPAPVVRPQPAASAIQAVTQTVAPPRLPELRTGPLGLPN